MIKEFVDLGVGKREETLQICWKFFESTENGQQLVSADCL